MKIFRTQFLAVIGIFFLYIILTCFAARLNDYSLGSWQSEIYNDKAGYYVYLPALFIHGFNQTEFMIAKADKIRGFSYKDGKLFTKYPLGVALLFLPFFLVSHTIALCNQGPADGFSAVYYEATYYGSVFYFMLGLIFLFKFLKQRYTALTSMLTVLIIMLGTHALYYGLAEPLFSHIYSFAMFSVLLWLTGRLWEQPRLKSLFPLVLVTGLILLVRPMNLIFLPVILFLGADSRNELAQRLKFLIKPLNFSLLVIILFLVLSPQLLYYKFVSGNYLFYTYGNEGFTNWKNPAIMEVLFAPLNGLLTYTPAFIFAFIGMAIMIFTRDKDRWLVPAVILMVIYMAASWHTFGFGCSFGQRSFVEYLALMGLPLATLLNWLQKTLYPLLLVIFSTVMIYFFYVNLSLCVTYPKCHEGEAWDWQPYWYHFYFARIFPVYELRDVAVWKDDFEPGTRSVFTRYHTGVTSVFATENMASMIESSGEFSDSFSMKLDTLQEGFLLFVSVSFDYHAKDIPNEVLLVCSLEDSTGIFYYRTFPVHEEAGNEFGSGNRVDIQFDMQGKPAVGLMKIYFWKKAGGDIYFDNISVELSTQHIQQGFNP